MPPTPPALVYPNSNVPLWRPTGDLIVPRLDHTATVLPDGKVLIACGESIITADEVQTSAELYDPATGTFMDTGNMTRARPGHTATLLNTGKVLIAGGFDARSAGRPQR
jgi:hypothetical protein